MILCPNPECLGEMIQHEVGLYTCTKCHTEYMVVWHDGDELELIETSTIESVKGYVS